MLLIARVTERPDHMTLAIEEVMEFYSYDAVDAAAEFREHLLAEAIQHSLREQSMTELLA